MAIHEADTYRVPHHPGGVLAAEGAEAAHHPLDRALYIAEWVPDADEALDLIREMLAQTNVPETSLQGAEDADPNASMLEKLDCLEWCLIKCAADNRPSIDAVHDFQAWEYAANSDPVIADTKADLISDPVWKVDHLPYVRLSAFLNNVLEGVVDCPSPEKALEYLVKVGEENISGVTPEITHLRDELASIDTHYRAPEVLREWYARLQTEAAKSRIPVSQHREYKSFQERQNDVKKLGDIARDIEANGDVRGAIERHLAIDTDKEQASAKPSSDQSMLRDMPDDNDDPTKEMEAVRAVVARQIELMPTIVPVTWDGTVSTKLMIESRRWRLASLPGILEAPRIAIDMGRLVVGGKTMKRVANEAAAERHIKQFEDAQGAAIDFILNIANAASGDQILTRGAQEPDKRLRAVRRTLKMLDDINGVNVIMNTKLELVEAEKQGEENRNE